MGYYPQIGANLAGIGDAIADLRVRRKEAQQERELIAASRSAIRPDGTLDFNTLATKLMGLGDIRSGMAASRMGFEQTQAAQEAERKRSLMGNMFGGGQSATPMNTGAPAAAQPVDMNAIASQKMRAYMQDGMPPSVAGPLAGRVAKAASQNTGAYRNAIASIESKGSGDYGAIGPTHPTLGRALGKYQIMEANVGPWSRKHLGREVTPEEFLANPPIQDAIFDGQFSEYVMAYGPEGAAQAWFAGPGGVGKLDRQDVLGTSVAEYTDRFNAALGSQPVQMADASGTVAIPQQQPEPAQAFQRGQRGQQDLRTFINSLPQAVQDSLRLVAQSDPDKALEMATGMFVDQQEARKERRQDRREQRREAPTLVTLYDDENGREYKARWDPKKQTYIQVGGTKAPSGTKFSVTNPDGTTVEYMAGDNNELTGPATNSVQTKAINASELGSRIAAIAQDFTPEDFTVGTRLANMWRAGKAKVDPSMLEPGEAEQLAGYASRRSGAIENINKILNELSGAAVSPAEGERLRAAQPDPGTGIFDGDDPITFKAKMERVLSDVQRSLARYRYYQTVGIPKNVEEIPLTDVQQVAGKWYVKRDGKVFEIGSDQEIQAQ